MNKKRKWMMGLLPLALVLALGAGVFYFAGRNSFPAFCEDLAKSSLSNNPLKLHYTLADPESMGYGGLSTTLLSFDQETYEKSGDVWQEYQARLNEYDPDSLTGEETFTWRLLYRYFSLEGRLSEYLYYENPLSPSDGAHIQLPVLLAEYTFRSREDVENYLTLLSQLPDYHHYQKFPIMMIIGEKMLSAILRKCLILRNSCNKFLPITFSCLAHYWYPVIK